MTNLWWFLAGMVLPLVFLFSCWWSMRKGEKASAWNRIRLVRPKINSWCGETAKFTQSCRNFKGDRPWVFAVCVVENMTQNRQNITIPIIVQHATKSGWSVSTSVLLNCWVSSKNEWAFSMLANSTSSCFWFFCRYWNYQEYSWMCSKCRDGTWFIYSNGIRVVMYE